MYSNIIKHRFAQCHFSDLFCNSLDNFFGYTKTLLYAQYQAINSKLNNKNYLDGFKNKLDIIDAKVCKNLLFYICEALCNVIKAYGTVGFDDIQFLSKETHNKKKSVLLFICNKKRIIYKPYDANYLLALSDIFDILKPYLKYDLCLIPKVLFYDREYFISNFIKESFCDDEICYYSIGVAMAFAYAMRIVDLHSDNIIFTKNGICLLDLETCFYRSVDNYDFKLYFTLLLSNGNCALNDQANKEFYIELNKNNEVTYLKNRDKINISVNIKHNAYIIKSGFHDCYKLIVKNKNKIEQRVLSSLFFTRLILRPTNFYTVCMLELFKPNINFSKNILRLKTELLNHIKGDINLSNIKSISSYELGDILFIDILFFRILNRDLYHNYKVNIS